MGRALRSWTEWYKNLRNSTPKRAHPYLTAGHRVRCCVGQWNGRSWPDCIAFHIIPETGPKSDLFLTSLTYMSVPQPTVAYCIGCFAWNWCLFPGGCAFSENLSSTQTAIEPRDDQKVIFTHVHTPIVERVIGRVGARKIVLNKRSAPGTASQPTSLSGEASGNNYNYSQFRHTHFQSI